MPIIKTPKSKIFTFLISVVLLISISALFVLSPTVYAATTPNLGLATSFSILSSTYANTVGGTTINGDLGYTSGPAASPTVNGITYTPPSGTYSAAGTDQASALSILNAQSCDFNFGSATALNSLPQPLTPGIYCITDAASVDGVGITLNGSGTYIFRMTGALNTAANTIVTLTGGASACDVFWTPGAATTLGANSTFAGTVIDDSGIIIGSTVLWTGRALAFGGTVSTETDTITTPTCTAATATPVPTTSPDATTSSSSNASSNSSSNDNTAGTTKATSATPIPTPDLAKFPNAGYGPQERKSFHTIYSGILLTLYLRFHSLLP